MRCFLALQLPEPAILALDDAGQRIREFEPEWAGEKWAALEVMHVTLRFFGELDDLYVKTLSDGLSVLIPRQPGFALTMTGLRAVPNARKASLIWASIEDASSGCAQLVQAVERVASMSGLGTAERRFTPHVTLVRARRPRSVQPQVLVDASTRAGLRSLQPMSVSSASLFASTLTPRGPIHERLAEFMLAADEGSIRGEAPAQDTR